MTQRLRFVEIDLAALAHNLAEVRRLVGRDVRVMAVIKADAYGHGLLETGACLAEAGAEGLGVMDVHEGIRLRDHGLKLPVYVLAGVAPNQCAEIVDRDLIPFLYDPALARDMNEAARKKGRQIEVQLKLDTGMSRLGAPEDQADRFFHQAAGLDYLNVTGLATHFVDADLEDGVVYREQIRALDRLIQRAQGFGLNHLKTNNAANSAAVLGLPEAHFQMVRPGLMLYGQYPAEHMTDFGRLKPAMRLTSQVVQVRTLRPGQTVSYGGTWRASRETVLATVPVGYAHGLNRILSNKGSALIRGRKAPVRGRVCMNLTMFDVTAIPGVAPGDEVVLLGGQGGISISARDVADLTGTISYEVLCAMGGLNHRVYHEIPG